MMLRYKVRTLLILLAVGPPVLASVVWLARFGAAGPIALAFAGYCCLVVVLIAVSRMVESKAPFQSRGICSYCGVAKRPLAEGPNEVLICRDCAERCIALIDEEIARQNQPATRLPPKADPHFQTLPTIRDVLWLTGSRRANP